MSCDLIKKALVNRWLINDHRVCLTFLGLNTCEYSEMIYLGVECILWEVRNNISSEFLVLSLISGE